MKRHKEKKKKMTRKKTNGRYLKRKEPAPSKK